MFHEIMNDHDNQKYEHTLRDKSIGKMAAIKALFGTIIVIPIIMVISVVTCSGADHLCGDMTPLIGIIYFPIVLVVLFVIFYVFYQATTDD